MNNIRNRGLFPFVVLAVLALAATRAQAQSDEVLTLDIKTQDAGSALLTLARSSGMQIMLEGGDAAKVEVEGLKGEFRLEEALAALLTDTGLAYEFTSENVVSVRQTVQDDENGNDGIEEEDAEAVDAEEALELGEQRVTGSRLSTGDPSARIYSFTAEDIAVRGVSSLEDFFRTLPWAFPTISTQTNSSPIYDDDYEKSLGVLAVGMSAINLRHLGSANTLVLVNGRRIAGTAGDFDNILNVLTVPLSAIERVDVQLDGASAVYGSDAIGGVVNFITRKNYRGVSATYRDEFSSTDANRQDLSVRGGFGWGSGNVSAALSRQMSEPIDHLKLWDTMDWRPMFGPEFDRRRANLGQPGVVCTAHPNLLRPRCATPANRRALPPDHSGVGATPEDFSADHFSPRIDQFWAQNGEDSTNISLNLYLEQYVTDSLRVYADVLVARHDAYQARHSEMRNYVVPASNAYNPFGEHVVVNYIPWAEMQAGIFQHANTESETEQRNYTAGLFWEFGDSHQLEVSVGRSKSVRSAWQVRYDYRRSYDDPTANALYEALASPDPDKALNLFGNGTVQGSIAADLFGITNGPIHSRTDITRVEPLLRGQLFDLWGGPIEYAVGAEYRRFEIEEYSEDYHEGELQRDTDHTGLAYWYGVDRPTRELRAYYFELALPIIGPANDRPGLRSLTLSIQARRDTYETEGAAGGQSDDGWIREPSMDYRYVPGEGWQTFPGYDWVNDQFAANLVEVKKAATSPRLGVHYKPVENFTLRTAWSRSFAPPAFNELFDTTDADERRYWYRDPYHPDGETGYARYPLVYIPYGLHLNPEYSDNYSIGFDWSPDGVQGLRWTLDWSLVDFTDRVMDSFTLLDDAREVTFKLPEFVQRDADGYITAVLGGARNIAEKRSKIVTTHLEYAFDTRVGGFISGLQYNRVLDEYYRVTPESEHVSRLGQIRGSNKYQWTGSLSWRRGKIGADLYVYHTPGYLNNHAGICFFAGEGRCQRLFEELPELDVDSLTTVDLTLTYLFDNGLRVRAGGRNIFLAESPTVWNRFQYDPTRWDARGRVLFLELNWEM